MTAAKFEQIRSSIEASKKKSTMAEGRKQSIEEKLLKDFGIEGDIATEVEAKQEKDRKSIEKDKKEREKLYNELEKCADWSEVEE
jgi:hypothetical protein